MFLTGSDQAWVLPHLHHHHLPSVFEFDTSALGQQQSKAATCSARMQDPRRCFVLHTASIWIQKHIPGLKEFSPSRHRIITKQPLNYLLCENVCNKHIYTHSYLLYICLHMSFLFFIYLFIIFF